MDFTGHYDIKGKKIYLDDYLKHSLEDVEGVVTKIGDQYVFGGCFELEHYGAEVRKITN